MEHIAKAELATIAAAEAQYLSTRKSLVVCFQLHQQAKTVLAELQLSFLKKVLCADDGQVPELMRLHPRELTDLLHRRRNAGMWELDPDCPNFRLTKETGERLRVEIVEVDQHTHTAYLEWAKDKNSGEERYAELRQWWREHPR
jgi:hypothetical protein